MATRVVERRRSPRVSCAVDGLMAVETSTAGVDCRIVDINQYGARIHVGQRRLPPRFFLIDVLGALGYSVEVKWRQGGDAGVRFHDIYQLTQPDAPQWLCVLRAERLAEDARDRGDALTSEIPDVDTARRGQANAAGGARSSTPEA